jgi:enamine deaminase RidA (YjgF/YER057c/UK114 family)
MWSSLSARGPCSSPGRWPRTPTTTWSVPGNLAAQARQAFANVSRCLAAAGARPTDVAMLRIYVVGHRPEYLPLISEARIAVFGDHRPADTIVGVERLAEDGRLIEVEATAVLD